MICAMSWDVCRQGIGEDIRRPLPSEGVPLQRARGAPPVACTRRSHLLDSRRAEIEQRDPATDRGVVVTVRAPATTGQMRSHSLTRERPLLMPSRVRIPVLVLGRCVNLL